MGESDVNVTVDMSGLRTFKAAMPESLESVREVWFTRTDGARGRLALVFRGMGIALPVGTYTVTGTTDDYQLVSCTLTVPADCPESLLLNFSGSSTGIHSAAQAQSPTARAEASGLRIAAPQGGRVNVSVFDLSGRRVLTAQAVTARWFPPPRSFRAFMWPGSVQAAPPPPLSSWCANASSY